MNIPVDLIYTQGDEWSKIEGDTATVGITDYAQEQLSDVVFVEFLVGVGDVVEKGQQIATVESVKAAAEVSAPVSGTVTAINEDLPQSPELVNKDSFGGAWMIRLQMSNEAETKALMDSDAYAQYVQERSH